jgi:DNA polymerase-3 subunit beta
VVIACANDVARPVLTAVYAKIEGEEVTFAATDSFRLSVRTLKSVPNPSAIELLIPARSIQELIRIVSQSPEVHDIELVVGEQQAVFKMGTVELYSRLLTGTFPKYQAIIPTTFVAYTDVATAEFLQALRLATIFSSSGIANVLLEVTEDGTLILETYGSNRGSTKNTLFAVTQPGFQPIKAAFNARFLLDAASSVTADNIQLRFSGQTSPLVIGTEEPDYVQLVMPIRMDA